MSMLNQWGKEWIKPRPYTMCVNKKTGAVYLKRQYPWYIRELPFVAAFVAVALFALVSCFGYIGVRTDIEHRIHRIEVLEQSIERMKNDNTLTERQLSLTPSLDDVYEIATDELGMVPAGEEQVIFYQRSYRDYVYQSDNLP